MTYNSKGAMELTFYFNLVVFSNGEWEQGCCGALKFARFAAVSLSTRNPNSLVGPQPHRNKFASRDILFHDVISWMEVVAEPYPRPILYIQTNLVMTMN